MTKRKATPRQLANLARGREKLFQKQLAQKGINPNPRPTIVREVIRQPTYHTVQQRSVNVNLSLFKDLIGTKFFPIEINNKKENLNLKEAINHLFSTSNSHLDAIITNQKNIDLIINHINKKDEEVKQEFDKLNKKITQLEKDNSELKKQLKEGAKDE